jgi:hypothetical protein
MKESPSTTSVQASVPYGPSYGSSYGDGQGTWRIVDVPGAELTQHGAAWNELVNAASDPNPFYEPWHLLPALRAFGNDYDLRFLLVYAPSIDGAAPRLCGFFPFEKRSQYKGLPARVLSIWQHTYCSLCTPLLRAGHERETLETLLGWLSRERGGAALIEWACARADGPFDRALREVCAARRLLVFTDECHERALLQPGARSYDEYLREALSRKRRKELKRLENRLAELGRLEYDVLSDSTQAPRWIEEFLRLEASGWKGRAGTAFVNQKRDKSFFREMALGGAQRGQLSMLALRLNGHPLAMKLNLHSSGGAEAPGAFSYKIAFDEDYARFSPGVLLELENIRQMHIAPRAPWMDSCAIPDHFMINRLWLERRSIQNIVVSVSKGSGDMVVSLLPLLRRIKQKLRRKPRGEKAQLEAVTPEDEGEET